MRSSPNDALETLLFWLDAVRRRTVPTIPCPSSQAPTALLATPRHVDVCEAQLRADPNANAGALQSLKRRDGDVWEKHADAAAARPMGVALLIFAHRHAKHAVAQDEVPPH